VLGVGKEPNPHRPLPEPVPVLTISKDLFAFPPPFLLSLHLIKFI
jgi:hypothetical protein